MIVNGFDMQIELNKDIYTYQHLHCWYFKIPTYLAIIEVDWGIINQFMIEDIFAMQIEVDTGIYTDIYIEFQ